MDPPRTLLVTNDYPPRVGGIQRTLESLVRQFPADRVAVLTCGFDGAAEFDRAAAYRIFRQPEPFLWPTPDVGGRVERAVTDFGAEVVLFGATYPLELLGPRIARSGTPYLTAAHGFEYWLSIAPVTHGLMRLATSRASRVPVLCSEFVARRVRTAVSRTVPVSVLYPGADLDVFRPDVPAAEIRTRHGLADRPLILCVSRLVARKGQDVLVRALPMIRERVADASLLIVGAGPYESALRSLASSAPAGSVVFAGEVDERELPHHYAAADVFAMPCRDRLGGLEVEGWGNVFIEAAACGRPVVAGRSGGAPEAVLDGETGIVVDGRDVSDVAEAVVSLLAEPERARSMGVAGRARVERRHAWPKIALKLAGWLRQAVG